MRIAALIFGVFTVAACSLDHVVVAALDAPSAGRSAGGGSGAAGAGSGAAGGESGVAGAIANASGGGRATLSGSAGQNDTVDTTNGGAAAGDSSRNSADGGVLSSRVFCACLSHEGGQLCGTDGITYPTECEDGGACLPPAIDCFHACPCLDNEPDGGVTTSLFPQDCVPMTECSGDVVCWPLTEEAASQQPSCPPANN